MLPTSALKPTRNGHKIYKRLKSHHRMESANIIDLITVFKWIVYFLACILMTIIALSNTSYPIYPEVLAIPFHGAKTINCICLLWYNDKITTNDMSLNNLDWLNTDILKYFFQIVFSLFYISYLSNLCTFLFVVAIFSCNFYMFTSYYF